MRSIASSFFKLSVVLVVLTGCGGSSSTEDSLNYDGELSAAELYSYRTTSFSENLVECSVAYLDSKTCSVSYIAPIGVELLGDVSIDDVANRLVVSHDWMAESFVDALYEMNDQTLLNLFKAVNAVVISYELEGSFYHGYTASIYINPEHLWRNSDEWYSLYQSTSDGEADEYELQFKPARRYVDATTGDYTTWSNSYNESSGYTSRSASQLAPRLYSLLAHELGHANDFLPPELLSTIDNSGTIYNDYILPNTLVSSDLNDIYPRNSELVAEAAGVYYSDDEITDELRYTTGADIGLEFASDGGSYFYSYKNGLEDLATLMEITMMYMKYDSVLDVAFYTVSDLENPTCDDLLIEWGQRNRLADSSVNERAVYVAERLISEDYALEVAAITEQPIMMEANAGWCSSRYDTATAKTVGALRSTNRSSSQVVHDYTDDLTKEPATPYWP